MGKTSAVITSLYDENVSRYASILRTSAAWLASRYPHPDLAPLFMSLPHRSIAVGPVALCDSTSRDLGGDPSDEVLGALGIFCLHISTHDDLVDEPPRTRREIAALTYAGNIAAIEGLRLLHSVAPRSVVDSIVEQVALNHLHQQECVIRLWDGKPTNFAEYRTGLEHDVAFVAIGVHAGLALAERMDLRDQLRSFCIGYGIALQLLDDIAEADQDRELGYHSFPLLEGAPYGQSFEQIHGYLDAAERSLDHRWVRARSLVEHARQFAEELQSVHDRP